jgi:uncharacterized integral membrane protein (TIGR00697 family)
MKKSTVTSLYMFLGVLFTSCLLISNVVANKLFQFGPWSLTAAVIVFPLSYIIGDVLAEVYGFRAARRVMWFGFAMNALMVGLFTIVAYLPVPVWFEHGDAYSTVLGNTPRLFAASMLAYILGSWINAVTLSKLKVKSNGKGFGFRAIVSTFFGEFVDSLIFVPVAFFGNMPFEELLKMMILQVTFKTVYEICILPVTTVVVKKVKKYDNIDVIDRGESYKLFG